jgi:tetratricopeptide (TPR) repeat protein
LYLEKRGKIRYGYDMISGKIFCFFTALLLTAGVVVCTPPVVAQSAAGGETLPDWFTALRDGIYEQNLKADEIAPLYRNARQRAEASLSGPSLLIMLSRCSYMMGRAYQYEGRKDEAAARYAEGMDQARSALDLRPSAEGWQILAENISQSCAVRPVTWAMANGLKVEQYAKNGLELDSRNAACRIMLASRYVYAPAPFGNFKKGIQMMEDIMADSGLDLQKDDRFNVYSGIGYAYYQQKKYTEARPWLLRSLEVYPSNKYARSLLDQS